MIEVILLERVGRLGQIGTVVKVKPGYARNFLLPRNKALRATKDNLAKFESQRAQIIAANDAAKAKAGKQSEKLDGKKFTLIRQASEVGHLFGSVTVRDVASLLHDAGFEVDRPSIALASPIKQVGIHKIEVHLHPEVSAMISLNIARTEDEAKVQEKTGQAAKAQAGADAEAAAKLEEANRALFEAPAEEAAPEAKAEPEAESEAKPKAKAKKE